MAKKRVDKETTLLLKAIKESMLEKKAEDIIVLNLEKIDNAITNYFIICSGNSETHVNTIAQYIEYNVNNTIKEKPWKKEGYEICEWVLLDYINVVVHVFQPKSREFFRLEQLWADAETLLINN
ncbi:MAG TPA: ribosome silencing factor [Bacteroidales bacterium]|nr:ribosome silencing factor [Bacteroidales bacterium]